MLIAKIGPGRMGLSGVFLLEDLELLVVQVLQRALRGITTGRRALMSVEVSMSNIYKNVINYCK